MAGHNREAIINARPPGGEELCNPHPQGIPGAPQLYFLEDPDDLEQHRVVVAGHLGVRVGQKLREKKGKKWVLELGKRERRRREREREEDI
ncbi:hypothetical protein TIFTF001_020426 [Ficus carica]|uniref:Uncharacterized protein n=1 Tax=Ficus carica TaxID=3494 RepID=A0AA88AXX1_FICCA|nr:hypothetical protein TIFTF001_020426 [Ficus carica]